ncbi:MAG: proline dehydrogenase [Sphingobacteriales bacterium]|nr:MAG: proline dehydrogenase [Sphingobacteriales bacterium]
MIDILEIGSQALRKAALNPGSKAYILNNEILFRTLRKAADRYIGGDTLDETIDKVIMQNSNGFKCSIEYMGENTRTVSEAVGATAEFCCIVNKIKRDQHNATVSLDLSHIGLDISERFCIENLSIICESANSGDIEVMISAEGVERTDQVLNIYLEAQKRFNNLGITLQAYLYRSAEDFKELISRKGRIRVVKGAFETPAGVSMSRGDELDEVYLDYTEQLLASGHLCSIATHDKKIQDAVKNLIEKYKPGVGDYEFESLYGIQAGQLNDLKNKGYPAKLYFVYGREWYLYLCNRIAEYPLNLFQALDDMLKK